MVGRRPTSAPTSAPARSPPTTSSASAPRRSRWPRPPRARRSTASSTSAPAAASRRCTPARHAAAVVRHRRQPPGRCGSPPPPRRCRGHAVGPAAGLAARSGRRRAVRPGRRQPAVRRLRPAPDRPRLPRQRHRRRRRLPAARPGTARRARAAAARAVLLGQLGHRPPTATGRRGWAVGSPAPAATPGSGSARSPNPASTSTCGCATPASSRAPPRWSRAVRRLAATGSTRAGVAAVGMGLVTLWRSRPTATDPGRSRTCRRLLEQPDRRRPCRAGSTGSAGWPAPPTTICSAPGCGRRPGWCGPRDDVLAAQGWQPHAGRAAAARRPALGGRGGRRGRRAGRRSGRHAAAARAAARCWPARAGRPDADEVDRARCCRSSATWSGAASCQPSGGRRCGEGASCSG